VFQVAYLLIPGLKLFRFPTRFLIVVELGLALLAAAGLTRLRADLARRWPASIIPALVTAGICALTVLDLSVHQPRQNPIVPAREWLTPPRAVEIVHADTPRPRTFTPRHRDFHRAAFQQARGWAKVDPYFRLRDVLEPNTGGGFWDTPSADCYAGISARWSIDVWGDHNREASLAAILTSVNFQDGTLRAHPALANVLRTFGVTHVLSPFPQKGTALTLLRQDPGAFVYRVEGSARARFVQRAVAVGSDKDAVTRLLENAFDPDREILLHDTTLPGPPRESGVTQQGTAAITRDDSEHVVVSVDAPADGYLLLADTYYPGWTADVDGAPAPVIRANLAARGVPVARGRHEVHFSYAPPGFGTGLWTSVAAILLLLAWAGAAAYTVSRAASVSAA
jgi:hypothetical protein